MESKDILNSDVIDIIFEGRNKEYGAYELRKNYKKRAKKSLVVCLVVAGVLASIPVIASLLNNKPKKVAPKAKITKLITPPPLDEKKPPPPPPPPPVKPQVKFTPPVIKKAEEVREEEKPPPKKELEKATASTVTVAGDENAKLDAPVIPDKGPAVVEAPPAPAKVEIFEFVEQMPEFPGGEDAMMAYIVKNLKYPKQAHENNINGKVVVNCVVNEDGNISDAKVVRGIKYGCDDEALRVVRSIPNWRPGKRNGKAVKVSYSLPITFQLEGE